MSEQIISADAVYIPTGLNTEGGTTYRERAHAAGFAFYAYDNDLSSFVYAVKGGKYVCTLRDVVVFERLAR